MGNNATYNNDNHCMDEQAELNFWAMKNLSTCEYESVMGSSAWAEFDNIRDLGDSSDDD